MQADDNRKSIIICEYISTGINFVDDALARGYTPVLVEGEYVGASPEDVERLRGIRERINVRMRDKVRIIKEDPDYDNILRQVKELDPAIVIAGSEFGVALATRLAADLGLPGNPVSSIEAMTHKDAMHQALKEHGLRYIEGKVVRSEEEAIEFMEKLGKELVVVKPMRGAGSQGVYMCRGQEMMLEAVRKHFEASRRKGKEHPAVLVQERIIGREYVVNTVSCNGKHRVVSVGKYDKYRLSNGSLAYNYFQYVTKLDVGHSKLLRYAFQVADAIGIKYGPIHGEYMVDENGPVLVEVNCRPMGGGLERRYSELITGQHETDSALDSYIDPEKFYRDSLKPYRLKRSGASKDIVLLSDTECISAPVVQICKRLRSYYSASYEQIGKTKLLPQTKDMETEAGLVYLLHDDEQQVRDDCELLHKLEVKYPEILFQKTRTEEISTDDIRDIDAVMKKGLCRGSTLIFSDKPCDVKGTTIVDRKTLKDVDYNYDQGILDLSDPASYADLESLIQQIFEFMDKIHTGGRIIVPESTYRHLPYGIDGMEILFKVSGMFIELPSTDGSGLLIATVN